MSEKLVFEELARRTVPVLLGGKEYVLTEASADDAIRWRNATMRATKWSPEGKVAGIDGLADNEALLVELCLKEVTPAGPGRVAAGFVRGLPARVLKALYDRALDLSDLREDGTDPRARQFANLLSRPDSPVPYAVMRDYVRKVLDGPDGHQFPNLAKFLEEEDHAPKG